MLGTLRDTLVSVQQELTSGVERLRQNVVPTLIGEQQRCADEAIDDILKTTAGSDLLLKFQISLEEMRSTSDEGARLANLCSTRMGRAQQVFPLKPPNEVQMCMERAEAVMDIDSFLRNTTDLENKIKDLNRKVDKLVRFCNQTEQAMSHLEALSTVARSEEEVDLIRQQAKSAMTIINMDAGLPATSLAEPLERPGDESRRVQEEVMLEEFLSSEPK